MPKVSIIIPIFNAQGFLNRAVESCLAQSLKDIEIILVDDKSADLSLQMAREFSKADSRVRVLANPRNLGTFLARKNGVDSAKGEFLLFLDADDYLSKNACAILYAVAVENRADMVHCKISLVPSKKFASKPKLHTQILRNDEILRQIFIKDFKKGYLIVCGKLFSANLVRRALNKLQFINCHLVASEDSALFLPLCAMAKKSVGTDNASYFYTQNPASLLKSNDAKKLPLKLKIGNF